MKKIKINGFISSLRFPSFKSGPGVSLCFSAGFGLLVAHGEGEVGVEGDRELVPVKAAVGTRHPYTGSRTRTW